MAGTLPLRLSLQEQSIGSQFYSFGYKKIHFALDNGTRLAFVVVVADKQKLTLFVFVGRDIAWFN